MNTRFNAEKTTANFITHRLKCWLSLLGALCIGAGVSFGQNSVDHARTLVSRLTRTPIAGLVSEGQNATIPLSQTPTIPAGMTRILPSFTFNFGLIDYPRSQLGQGVGINDGGEVVGGYNGTTLDSFTADHGFRLHGDAYTTVDFPGALQTELIGINKKGQIVGTILDTSFVNHGFKLVNGVFTQLDYPGADFTVTVGINNSGTIIGTYAIGAGSSGYLLKNNTYTSISVSGALFTYLSGINNHGVIVGYYFDSSNNSHGFTWNNGAITTLDYGNGFPNTYLAGITDAGVIAGGYGSSVTINSVEYIWEHGFLYSSGTFSTFDAPFGDVAVTQPFGINNKGQIVGGYLDGQGMLYGFYAKAQ